MQTKQVKLYLFLSLLLLSIIPLSVSLLILDRNLDQTFQFINYDQFINVMSSYQSDLKRLSSLDAKNSDKYKNNFYKLEKLKLIYEQQSLIKKGVKLTFFKLYFIIVMISLILALLISIWLTRKISKAYKSILEKTIEQNKNIQKLDYLKSWQLTLRELLHEIKNPLTPIEIANSELLHLQDSIIDQKIKKRIELSTDLIDAQVTKIKYLLNDYNEFAKLENCQLINADLRGLIVDYVNDYKNIFSHITFELDLPSGKSMAELDPTKIGLVFFNLVKNASEANLNDSINIKFKLRKVESYFKIIVSNTGKEINNEIMEKMFKTQTSSHYDKNRGMGLLIIQKVMLEHRGKIFAQSISSGMEFILEIPIA